ncbi:MAG: hypothetical protein WBA57_16620 [Elainellaceae cyanobacterium]
MAHSNQSFSTAETYGRSKEPPTVELFNPHSARRQGRSPEASPRRSPVSYPPSGIPPLSSLSSHSMPLPSTIPNSVRARAGLPPSPLPSLEAPNPEAPNLEAPNPNTIPPYDVPQRPAPSAGTRSNRRPSRRSRRPISTQHSSPDGMRSLDFRYLVAGSSLLAGLVLMGDVSTVFQGRSPNAAVCQEVVQQEAVLSRESLSQLLTVPERESKATVREIVSQPYCLMPDLEVRADVKAQREAYPLEFDPDTWLVLLYEEEEYAGYDFSFQP